MSKPTTTQLIHAYRNLFRAGLKAVQYSTPARYSIRDKLRRAFRPPEEYRSEKTVFDQEAIDNTVQFLEAAAANKGTEHKIVKNLCDVYHWRYANQKRRLVGRCFRFFPFS
jgi:hypothetical protein